MADRSGQKVCGINWGEGAICNARWAGARLRDVLSRAGVSPSPGLYANFLSCVTPSQDDARGYGASIPLEKALDAQGDVLVAYEVCDIMMRVLPARILGR